MKRDSKLVIKFTATSDQIALAAAEVYHRSKECPDLVRVLEESGLGDNSSVISLFYLLAESRRKGSRAPWGTK